MEDINKKVFIYALKHPDTQEIRYIGKTTRTLSRRIGNHVANAKGNKHNKHLSHWILKLLQEGKRPIIQLIEECNELNWKEREIYWISQYKNLINLTIGGDGCEGYSHDQEAIEKCRQANLGKKHSTEFKVAMSLRLKGKPLSNAHKEKIKQAHIGKTISAETRKNLSNSHKGIIQSEESKLKRSQTIKIWWAKRKNVNKDIVES